MKIAIFIPYNIFKHGGVQEHVKHQADILRKRGHDVTILTPRPRLTKHSDVPDDVIFLGTSARIKAPHATSADVSISLDNDAIDTVLANDYDIIHVHEPLVPVSARQILQRADGKAVRIGTFHAALPGNRLGKSLVTTYKGYARAVMPHVDAVTAVSPAAIGYIEQFTHVPINYIPNGIETSIYKSQSLKRDRNLIVFIGRLEKRKGARQAIKAFAELKKIKPKAKLKIAGDGPLRNSLEQYVKTQNIEGIEFLGFVDLKTKLKLLSTCGVYTSPALYGESFGIVLAEAMAMEAPIVCHPNNGYQWVMEGSGRLSLVDCMDYSAYADRLKLMLEEDDIRDLWLSWARKRVAQFDYEKIVDSYEKLYKQALK